jgi:simple sugar transport system substrate-binding protein
MPEIEGISSEVAQDDYDLAFLSLKRLIQDLNGQGKIGVIWVGGFAPMEKRQRVLNIMQQQYPGIEVVSTFGEASANTVADTQTKTEAALQANPDIQAFWASWDQFALGAYAALKQAGREDVGLYSIDISPEDAALMREEGSMWKATAAADAREVGRVLMRQAINAAYGEVTPRFVQVPAFLVTQEQLRDMPEGEMPHDVTDLGWTPFLVALKNLIGQ